MTLSHHRHRSLILKILDRHIHDNLNDPGSLSGAEKAEREELLEIQDQLTQAVYAPENSPVVAAQEPVQDEMDDDDMDGDEEEVEEEAEAEPIAKVVKKRKR